MMCDWLEVVKIGVSMLFLSYASWQDHKNREVSNRVWMYFAPLGLALTLLQIFLIQQFCLFVTLAASTIVVSGISITLFYLGLFGGADAKAFICLSITFPVGPVLLKKHLNITPFLFSLAIFDDAVLTSALTALGLIFYNVLWGIRTREKLFEGFEQESFWKKFLVLITGYKIKLARMEKKQHLVPLEDFSEKEDGSITHNLRVLIHADEDIETRIISINKFKKRDDKIWVTPNLPFIIFITIGLIVSLFLGDIILLSTYLIVSR